MFFNKISSDFLLLVLLVVRLRLDSDFGLDERYMRQPESREVFLGSSSAYTQITFHSPYSNLQYAHPKSLELNEEDVLFNRLHYFNSVRERSLLAYYASHPVETPNPEAASGGDTTQEETAATAQELTPEDRDLIEILWKQDIDLGVSRDAYDSRSSLEVEKIKDVEYSKENLQEFYMPGDGKETEESPDPLAGFNYTVDSETGEFIFDGLVSGSRLLDNGTLNCDSYLPFNEDDLQLQNLTDIFETDEFPDLLTPNYTDSDAEYLLSHIDKELESFVGNDPGEESMYSQPGDVFPNLDDCWPDSTTMLPLLALGNSHPSPFISLSPRPESTYQSTTLTSSVPSRPTDGFTSIFHNSSLEASTAEETFHAIPTTLGPSSVGCALAESIATLHNDTDPIPSNSLINTAYNPDLPDLLYTNQTLNTPQNELLMHDLFTDEDFQLASLSSNVNQRILRENPIDSSSDSASLTSVRVPSVSDCPDWIDSCSESSSHQTLASHALDPVCNSEHFHSSLPPKRHRHNDAENSDLGGSPFEASNRNDLLVKSEYSDVSYRKYDYSNSRTNLLHHNHSYHLPFTNEDSRYKPLLRDKSEEEETANKDEKRARELNLPISIDDIINLAIEEYNERLSKYELTDQQLNLIRDIRRRGKNKVAAQNCRKRKMDQISCLQQDLDVLQEEKMQLKSKQDHLLEEKHRIEDKYAQLYQIVSQFTKCKAPGPSNSVPVQMTLPSTPENAMSDEDSEPCRGARAKRKLKK